LIAAIFCFFKNAKNRERGKKNAESAERRKWRKFLKDIVTIQLLKPNNSVLDNIALRTASSIQPLFIQFPLVANKATTRALMPLFFRSNSKNKGIRARVGTLSATKGNVINKGAMIKSVKCGGIGLLDN
jgi:hypothetical protein